MFYVHHLDIPLPRRVQSQSLDEKMSELTGSREYSDWDLNVNVDGCCCWWLCFFVGGSKGGSPLLPVTNTQRLNHLVIAKRFVLPSWILHVPKEPMSARNATHQWLHMPWPPPGSKHVYIKMEFSNQKGLVKCWKWSFHHQMEFSPRSKHFKMEFDCCVGKFVFSECSFRSFDIDWMATYLAV